MFPYIFEGFQKSSNEKVSIVFMLLYVKAQVKHVASHFKTEGNKLKKNQTSTVPS